MIPLETYKTIVDQTNDLNELLELKENIRSQKYDVMRDFDRMLQNSMKTMILPNIESLLQSGDSSQVANIVEAWGKQAGAKKMMSTQKDFNKTIEAYDNLIKFVLEKCRKLIWETNDDKA